CLSALPLYVAVTAPPPGSTLFPYTTLFRSRRAGRTRFSRTLGAQFRCESWGFDVGHVYVGHLEGHGYQVVGHRAVAQQSVLVVEDRKSTRLNSSHVKNSYAVFCLKKKNVNK